MLAQGATAWQTMADTYHDEVIIKVRANLDSKMVTRLFTDNPVPS